MAISQTLKVRASGFAVALALLAPLPALAQAQAADSDSKDEEIVVTGTSIRGEPPVGSALIQVGRADIDASPAVTTTQLVREVPQIFNFGVTDAARNQSGGAGNIVYGNSINIRGLGPFATLTLMNGRRPVPQGTLGRQRRSRQHPGDCAGTGGNRRRRRFGGLWLGCGGWRCQPHPAPPLRRPWRGRAIWLGRGLQGIHRQRHFRPRLGQRALHHRRAALLSQRAERR